MNRFTIAPDFLEYCAREAEFDLFRNVLFVFTQDNQFKICMDKLGLADASYRCIIERSEIIRFWLEMLNCKSRNIECVAIPNVPYATQQDLFLEIANAVPPKKRLVTSDKSLFDNWLDRISTDGITLFDGDEAKVDLQPKTITQISLGDGSPNIVGNQNQINP